MDWIEKDIEKLKEEMPRADVQEVLKSFGQKKYTRRQLRGRLHGKWIANKILRDAEGDWHPF